MNRYISMVKVKNMFKGNNQYEFKLRTINCNGQKRGCSGFIYNKDTEKYCYLTTEPFFDGGNGSGLFGDKNCAICVRTAKNDKDYTGGINNWCSIEDLALKVNKLTQ